MKFVYDEIEIEYQKNTFEGVPVLLLHGWGGDIRSFSGLFNKLTEQKISAINLAFPYKVPISFGIYEYADLIEKLLAHLNVERVIAAGHSFGGRVAMILASRAKVHKLILIDSAGIKPRINLLKKIKIYRYKIAKRLGKNTDKFGSSDYKSLDQNQKQVFTRIVNQHLENVAASITIPTLIFWGKTDKDTPIYMAKKLNKLISDSAIIMLDGGHYCYIEDKAFIPIFISFVNSLKE